MTRETAATQKSWKPRITYIPRLLMFPLKRKKVTSTKPRTIPIISRSAAAKED